MAALADLPDFTLEGALNDCVNEAFAKVIEDVAKIASTTDRQVVKISDDNPDLLRKCLESGLVQVPDDSCILLTWVGLQRDGPFKKFSDEFASARKSQLTFLTSTIFGELIESIKDAVRRGLPLCIFDPKYSSRVHTHEEPLSASDKKEVSGVLSSKLTDGKFSFRIVKNDQFEISLPLRTVMADSIFSLHQQPRPQKQQQQQTKPYQISLSEIFQKPMPGDFQDRADEYLSEFTKDFVNLQIANVELSKTRLNLNPLAAKCRVEELKIERMRLDDIKMFFIDAIGTYLYLNDIGVSKISLPDFHKTSYRDSHSPPQSPLSRHQPRF